MISKAKQWRLKKLKIIKDKLKRGEDLTQGEKMALRFWKEWKMV
jgi:hypothetical protein